MVLEIVEWGKQYPGKTQDKERKRIFFLMEAKLRSLDNNLKGFLKMSNISSRKTI